MQRKPRALFKETTMKDEPPYYENGFEAIFAPLFLIFSAAILAAQIIVFLYKWLWMGMTVSGIFLEFARGFLNSLARG